jgi:hypothetical protein
MYSIQMSPQSIAVLPKVNTVYILTIMFSCYVLPVFRQFSKTQCVDIQTRLKILSSLFIYFKQNLCKKRFLNTVLLLSGAVFLH